MIKRCRFCGEKIQSDATDCEHCGKVLVKKSEDEEQKVGFNDIESWKSQSVPSWVMYAVVIFTVLYVGLMVSKGCSAPGMGDEEDQTPPVSTEMTTEPESTSFRLRSVMASGEVRAC